MDTIQAEEISQVSKPFLDARIEANKLRERYINDPRQHSLRVLLLGEGGHGKTHLCSTARRPIHFDSFDPGGTTLGPIQELIQRGWAVADTVYESEDRTEPSMFREWARTFEQRIRSKYFEAFGTYVLDSSTLWSDAIMNWVLASAKDKSGKSLGLAGQAPRWSHDYVPQKMQIRNWMKRVLDLPCDVIVTGHLKDIYEMRHIGEEDVNMIVDKKYLTTGDGAIIIPLMFSEVWIALREERGQRPEYRVITSCYKLYQAKTRLGSGKFDTLEEPNIKGMLRKVGWATNDKEKL